MMLKLPSPPRSAQCRSGGVDPTLARCCYADNPSIQRVSAQSVQHRRIGRPPC